MVDNCWYSWIPTNLGELNFDYFGKSKEIENKYQRIRKTSKFFYIQKLDISFISDTYTPLSKWLNPLTSFFLPSLEGELYGSVDLLICKDELNYSCKIRLSYPENFMANAEMSIEQNGKFKISKIMIIPDDKKLWSEFEDYEKFKDYLAQVIFIIVKGIIHGDNHHHQKIDTAITVNRGSFDSELIIKNLIKHIKRVEHDIKNLDRCYGEVKSKNAVEEMKGYRSYISTFRSLFLHDTKAISTSAPIYVTDSSILDNVIASLESSVKRNENKPSHRTGMISISLIYLAAAVSGAILYINIMGTNYNSHVYDFSYFKIYILVLFFLAILHLRCIISSFIFYNYYNLYEYLFHLEAIKKPKGIINKVHKFFWINKYSFISLIITVLIYFN